jgi:hypothetical protein
MADPRECDLACFAAIRRLRIGMVDFEWLTTFGFAETSVSICCPPIIEKQLGISGTRMTSISYKDDLLRIGSLVVPWWLQALWVLLFVSLVTGYAIWSSGYRFSGRLEIYSRQDDPFNYWITLLYYVGITGFLTYVVQ